MNKIELPIRRASPKTIEETKADNPFATHEMYLKDEQVNTFEELIKANSEETAIDRFLRDNPEIFTAALHNHRTGHHATCIIPKQSIRPHIQENGQRGLIPDFIVGGKSSDGWEWWVVEIKGANQTLFTQTKNETYFSSEINKGICQLLEYIDFCSEYQEVLRSVFRLQDFREPKGLLIAGREGEVTDNESKQKLKAAWNRVTKEKLEIRTYDWLTRSLRALLSYYKK